MADQSAILEIRRIGLAIQVSAIDPVTLTEISFQAPANSPPEALRRLAAAKLGRALERKAASPSSPTRRV